MGRINPLFRKYFCPVFHRKAVIKIGLHELEDRSTPSLFTQLTPQTSSQLANNGFVASGDWNGDGFRDIVMTNYGNGSVSGVTPGKTITFAYGDGNGKFGSYISQAVGPGNDLVSFLAVGDLNNDGHPDIVTVQTDNTNENGTMTVFLGSAAGAFTKTNASPMSTEGSRASWVGIADFNQDGKRDVAVVNLGETGSGQATGRTIAIFKGDGQGGLSSFQKYDIPQASGVATAGTIADLNGDSWPDLAVTFANVPPDSSSPQINGSVRVFLNKQDGSLTDFASASEYDSGGPLPISIVAADYSGDGFPDLIVANAGDPDNDGLYAQFGQNKAVGTLTNGGSGTFGPTTIYNTGFNSAFAVAVADFNLDSKLDIAIADIGKPASLVSNPVAGGITILLGKTTGQGFLLDVNSPYVSPADAPQYLVVDSFNSNSDNSPDIVLVHESNKIVTFLNTTVPATPTSTSLKTSGSPTTYGESITLTATVTAPTGTPTGTVTFLAGTTPLGTANLVTIEGNQVAEFVTSGTQLNAGNYTLTARYDGSKDFQTSTSSGVSHIVNPASSKTSLSIAPNPALEGELVTFTAIVSAGVGTPIGNVEFWEAGFKHGSKALSNVGGKQTAVFTISTLSVGDHTIVAKYVGAGNHSASSSDAVTVTINADDVDTTTTLKSSINPAMITQQVTFTATVTAESGSPTGTVEFWNGGSKLGIGTLVTVSGQQLATFSTTSLALGKHDIVAKYLGDAGFNPSTSASFTQAIDKISTTITVGSGDNSTFVTENAIFTATVTGAIGSPTGTVTFYNGGVPIGLATLEDINGKQQAIFTTDTLSVGTHTITAKYAETGNFFGSTSQPLNHDVTLIGTTVSLATSSNPATVLSEIQYTATISSQFGSPAGQIEFYNGATLIGVGVIGAGQQATFTTSTLPVGTHSVVAKYNANVNFLGSSSTPVTQTVDPLTISVTLTANPLASTLGSSITLSATFPSGAPALPTGTVAFRTSTGTLLGSSSVTASGATVFTSSLPVGTYLVTAVYSGDVNFQTASSNTITLEVNPVSPPPPPPSPPPPVSPPPAVVPPGTVSPVLVGFREFGVGAGDGHPADARFFNPDGTERFSMNLFPGFAGGVRVTSADFNGDGIADLVAGTGPGRSSQVMILDGVTKAQLFSIEPFEPTFTGGVYITTGDLNGDGVPDLAISPDEGGGPRVRVFDGKTFQQIVDFFGIEDPGFRGGARAGIGDITGDGIGDLVVSAGFLGGPRVSAWDGSSADSSGKYVRKPFADFFAFDQSLRNGVYIAVGDLDGDGKAELISGAGPGGGPHIIAFSGSQLLENRHSHVANFFGGNTENRGGIRLVARNLDGDNLADIVIGDGVDAGTRVTGYLGKMITPTNTPDPAFSFDAYPGFTGGVYVG